MDADERARRVHEFTEVVLGDVEHLTDLLVQRILDEEPAYRQLSVVALQDLRQSCRANLADVVTVLRDAVPEGVDVFASAAATGRRRAAQGMSLHAVLHSYSLGGRVILDAVAETAEQYGSAMDSGALLHVAVRVWETMDRFSSSFAAAYREEELRLQREHRHQQQRDVSAVVRGDLDDDDLRAAADRLGLVEGVPFAVVVVLVDDPAAPQFATATALAAHGVQASWAVGAWHGVGTEIGLVQVPDGRVRGLAQLARSAVPSRIGVSAAVTALSDAAVAARLARLTALTLPAAAAAAVEDRLPQALLLDAPDLSALLLQRTIDALGQESHDRAALIDTVAALLRAGGSQTAAAAALYCHRNTVRYRLARVVELTDSDPTTADGALLWSLALLAAEQRATA